MMIQKIVLLVTVSLVGLTSFSSLGGAFTRTIVGDSSSEARHGIGDEAGELGHGIADGSGETGREKLVVGGSSLAAFIPFPQIARLAKKGLFLPQGVTYHLTNVRHGLEGKVRMHIGTRRAAGDTINFTTAEGTWSTPHSHLAVDAIHFHLNARARQSRVYLRDSGFSLVKSSNDGAVEHIFAEDGITRRQFSARNLVGVEKYDGNGRFIAGFARKVGEQVTFTPASDSQRSKLVLGAIGSPRFHRFDGAEAEELARLFDSSTFRRLDWDREGRFVARNEIGEHVDIRTTIGKDGLVTTKVELNSLRMANSGNPLLAELAIDVP